VALVEGVPVMPPEKVKGAHAAEARKPRATGRKAAETVSASV
jgi:hypothetical protein